MKRRALHPACTSLAERHIPRRRQLRVRPRGMARLCRGTPLTRAAEVDLLKQLERAELEIARTLLGSEAAVAEYGTVFTGLREHRLRAADVTRQSPLGNLHEEHCRVGTAFEAVEELGRARRAGLSGRGVEEARRRADLALGILRPSRALLDRVASALRAQCAVASDGETTLLALATCADSREMLAAVASSERQARRLRSQLVEANQGLVMSIAKRARCEGLELSESGAGRECWARAGGRPVRLRARLQIRNVCHLLDSPKHQRCAGKQGTHDPLADACTTSRSRYWSRATRDRAALCTRGDRG